MSKDNIITVIATIDLIDDEVINGSTDFVFYKKFQNAINSVFDKYYNSDEWEIYDRMTRQDGNNLQHVFIFDNTEVELNTRTVIVEDVSIDDKEMEELADLIEYED